MGNAHHQIPLLSNEWWGGIAISLVVITIPLVATAKMSAAARDRIGKIIGSILFLLA